jgi:predicted HD phosphohydrolase
MSDATAQVVKFSRLDETTAADWARIDELEGPFIAATADRVLSHLKALKDEGPVSMEVGRYEHSLQTATRAFRDGQNEELIVAALLHDIGDLLAPHDHGEIAATILKPFVTPMTYWVVRLHPIFQGYFFFDKIGHDRNAREKFRGHSAFEPTARFCGRYDQVSFDMRYPNLPLQTFEPMVRRIFAREPWKLWGDTPRPVD